MTKRRRRGCFLFIFLFAALFFNVQKADASIPTEPMGTIQVDPYYKTLRDSFYQGGYEEVGACNGWVEHVIDKSGLVGDFKVGGTVLELNDAMKNSDYFTLVASREGGQNDYQEATDQMIRDVNEGKIRAGDILIFTKNMTDMSASGAHWLHAAIVMEDIYAGQADNTFDRGEARWKVEYIGYPTMAHALAPDYGVEYLTPLTTPSSPDAEDSGSTGYYVYRIDQERRRRNRKKKQRRKPKRLKRKKRLQIPQRRKKPLRHSRQGRKLP